MKVAAFAAFAVAAVAGLVLAVTTAWWLIAVGVLAILAAWFYTGGAKPYGYLGLGEVMVFVFFGLVAVVGTTYVQSESFDLPALYAGVGLGALITALLVVNNLRDIPTDRAVGKRTLAVMIGADRTRGLYGLLTARSRGSGRRSRGRHHVVGAARAAVPRPQRRRAPGGPFARGGAGPDPGPPADRHRRTGVGGRRRGAASDRVRGSGVR